jgi:Fe-S-cluster containining protein
LDAEADQISTKTSKIVKEFAEEKRGSEPYVYLMKKDHGKCFFLRDGSCQIYNIRPLVCRFYPFRLEALGEERYAFHFTEECPGIGKGPRLKEEYFRKLFSQFLHACRRRS